eukprot:1663888-Rhodomonas_salina.1
MHEAAISVQSVPGMRLPARGVVPGGRGGQAQARPSPVHAWAVSALAAHAREGGREGLRESKRESTRESGRERAREGGRREGGRGRETSSTSS